MQKVKGLSKDVTLVASVVCWRLLHMLSFPAGDKFSDNSIAWLAKLLQQLDDKQWWQLAAAVFST